MIAESAIIPFSITNIGGAILNNLSYTNLTSQNNRLSIVTGDNACLAGASLSIGESCVLYVKYTPLQTETSSMKLAVNGNYIANGNSLNYTSGYSGANYSSVGSAAQITISPKQLDFAINANNLAFQSKSLVLTNIGEVAAQIKSITLPNIAGLTLNNPNACGNTLASGAHCTLNLKFGPINHIESVASGSLRVNYLPTSSSTDSVSASVGINTKSSIVALIQVESNNTYPFGFYADGSGFISGSGSPSSPFLFSSYLNAMTVHILYSNNGSESALNFNVNTNISPGLPIAISVANSSTCATGLNTMTLAVGTSCILDLNLLSPSAASLAYNPQPVEFRIPGYSFQGITNPLTYSESRVVAANGQSSIYTQAQQAASYTMSTSRQSTSINSDGSQTAMITFNVDSFGSGVNTITFAPIITDLQGFYFSDANGNSNGISSCTTTNPAVATCTIYITAPVYAPYATYSVLYYAHVNGISSDDANTGIFTFTTHAGS